MIVVLSNIFCNVNIFYATFYDGTFELLHGCQTYSF